MNNEQQNNDARFYLKDLKFGCFAICAGEAPEDANEVCIYWNQVHPYAKKAAEAERDRLNDEWRQTPTETPFDY